MERMKKAPSRPFTAFLAGAGTFLTCFLAAQRKWDGIGFPIPWQYHDHGWTPIDYRILVADVVILLLSYPLYQPFC
jgi:hypothetical protein